MSDYLAFNSAAGGMGLIPFDTEPFDSETLTLAASQLTVPAGIWFVDYQVSVSVTSGTSRTQVQTQLQVNGVNEPGTVCELYCRTNNFGASGSASAVITNAAAAALRVNGQVTAGGSTVQFRAGGCRLMVTRLK